MKKPYAESCDENRDPILAAIEPLLKDCSSVLEIGSGTGQHAVYFAERMPHLLWQTSDCAESRDGISLWLRESGLANTPAPIELDVAASTWPEQTFDAVFSANTMHIMHWTEVEAMIAGVGSVLASGGPFLLYGPFNYNNAYTSASNARFDAWLKQRDPASGIRNFEDIDGLSRRAGMVLSHDYAMPANNRILHWVKT